MEIVFPVSMLVIGLVVGTVSLWFITRTKLKYEFERGRVEGETERATLIERLAGKDRQLQELAELRLEHRQTLSTLSPLLYFREVPHRTRHRLTPDHQDYT